MTTGKLTVPTIHINGTAKKDLVEPLLAAHRALIEAREAVHKTVPNGRDYYPQGDDAIRTALREHQDRVNRLYAIEQEIESLCLAIIDL